jgi:hypothetical protein
MNFMKRFKISFLAIMALFAIGLTAATKADAFKKVKPSSTFLCDKDIATHYTKGDFKNPITGTEFSDYYNDDRTTGTSISCFPGQQSAVFCAKNLQHNFSPNEDFLCEEGTDEFCCAVPESEASPCGVQASPIDLRTWPVKVTVYCKPE